jgi:two-component system, LytTR family, response regulator
MNMTRAIIIDDEEISLRALGEKVRSHCPDIEVLKLFSKPEEALKEIDELKPGLVFLDIEMPKMNGFTFLRHCGTIDFEVIFTTAYSEYAIEALRVSALDFLQKPIDVKELITAVERLEGRLRNKTTYHRFIEQQVQLFLQHQQSPASTGKIALPVMNGLKFIDVHDVIKVRGDNVYSVFYLVDGKKEVASLTLKETEALLARYNFFRVHKSFIVNLAYIVSYIKGEGGVVVMSDGSEVEISRRNKADFLKKMST